MCIRDSQHTGQSLKTIEKAVDRDNFMNSEEAKTFGLIDEVVTQRPVTEDEVDEEVSEKDSW